MSIKATVKPSATKTAKPFPKLMKGKTSDSLFYISDEVDEENLEGLCLSSKYDTPGRWAKSWLRDSLVDFDGSVTLQNE